MASYSAVVVGRIAPWRFLSSSKSMSSATAQSSGSRLDRSAERKDRLALGLGVLIAHQTEAHLAAVDGLDIGVVVAEQFRAF